MDPITGIFLLAFGAGLAYVISKGMNGGMTTPASGLPKDDPGLPPLPDATSLDCDAAFAALPNDPPTYLRSSVKTLYTSGVKSDVTTMRNLADAIGSLAMGDKLLTQAAQCLHMRANEIEAGGVTPSFPLDGASIPLSIEPGSGSSASSSSIMTGRVRTATRAATRRGGKIG